MSELSVSVIIPTYNRVDSLRRTLDSLVQQTYPKERFEVIVVDDGSTDETPAVAQQQFPFALRYIHQDHEGGTSAKNTGASAARGQLLAFLDDDIQVQLDYILSLVEVHERFPKAVVVGDLVHIPTSRDSMFARVHSHTAEQTCGDQKTSEIPFTECLGGFFSIRKPYFFELGMLQGVGDGWPNWEDVIFGYRAHKAGFSFLRAWRAKGYHYDKSLSSFRLSRDRWYRASGVAPLLFNVCPALELYLPMFRDKTPISLTHDHPSMILRKVGRAVTAWRPVLWGMEQLVRLLESVAPLPALLRPLYRWTISSYIYRGYRQGLRAYGQVEGPS